MSNKSPLDYQLNTPLRKKRSLFSNLLVDPILIVSILIILIFGLFALYSASGQLMSMVLKQGSYILFGLIMMLFISQIDQAVYKGFLTVSYTHLRAHET